MSQGHGARREALARPFAAGLLCPGFSRIQAALVMRDWGHVKCWRGAGHGGGCGWQLGAWLSDHLRFDLCMECESVSK